jgi:hypothetical protein
MQGTNHPITDGFNVRTFCHWAQKEKNTCCYVHVLFLIDSVIGYDAGINLGRNL